jgi:hypothetical protein
VTLDGSGADGDPADILSFEWTEAATPLGTAARITVPLGVGTHALTLTVSDRAGLSATACTTVTVTDTTAPLVHVPADAVLEATSPGGDTYTYAAAARDLVDGEGTPTCAPVSGATFPLGATPVTCSATDARGNLGSAAFTVTVTDTTAPVITVPGNVTVEATSGIGAIHNYAASASDAVDGTVAISCTPRSGAPFPIGATPVTCSATDAHGNRGSAAFSVTVTDTTAPVITVPGNITVEATSGIGAIHNYAASASDAVDGTVAISCTHGSATPFPIGATLVTYSATDAQSNAGSASFTLTVTDTTAPVVHAPADAVLEATSAGGATYTYIASATDVVDGEGTPMSGPASGTTFPLGATPVT